MNRADLALVFIMQALWAGSYSAMKLALREVPVEILVLMRYGITALILFSLTSYRREHQPVRARDWPKLLILASAVFIVAPLLAFFGLKQTQAMDASVLIVMEPLITVGLAFFVLSERPNRAIAAAIFLAVPGVLLLSGVHWQGDHANWNPIRLMGNLLFLTSLICEASYTVFSKKLGQHYNPLAFSTYTHTGGFLIFALICLPTIIQFPWAQVSGRTWLAAFYLGGVCSAFGYTAWVFLLKRVPANKLAMSLYWQPLVGALIGYGWLGERFGAGSWIGATMILLSMVIINRPRR